MFSLASFVRYSTLILWSCFNIIHPFVLALLRHCLRCSPVVWLFHPLSTRIQFFRCSMQTEEVTVVLAVVCFWILLTATGTWVWYIPPRACPCHGQIWPVNAALQITRTADCLRCSYLSSRHGTRISTAALHRRDTKPRCDTTRRRKLECTRLNFFILKLLIESAGTLCTLSDLQTNFQFLGVCRFGKQIRYASRKARADTRKRVKGRFVKAGEAYDYDPLRATTMSFETEKVSVPCKTSSC